MGSQESMFFGGSLARQDDLRRVVSMLPSKVQFLKSIADCFEISLAPPAYVAVAAQIERSNGGVARQSARANIPDAVGAQVERGDRGVVRQTLRAHSPPTVTAPGRC